MFFLLLKKEGQRFLMYLCCVVIVILYCPPKGVFLHKVNSLRVQSSLGLLLKSSFCDVDYLITLQGTGQFNRRTDN